MATLAQIRDGIKTNLDAVFTNSAWQVFAEMQTDPIAPSIDISPAHPVAIEYDSAFQGGGDEYLFVIRAVVQQSVYTNSQQQLETLMDARSVGSVKQAVEADMSLGGLVGSTATRVIRCSGYHIMGQKQGGTLLAVEFLVQVLT